MFPAPTEGLFTARRFRRTVLALCGFALILEASSRAALSTDAVFNRIVSPYDEPSWRLRWLRRHQAGTAPFRFTFDRHHPVRGWTLAPGLRSNEAFSLKRLTSNSQGLRGEREYAIPKPAGVFRIALFGDSFTFGEDVSDAETFAQRLQDLMPGVEILNFGIHGYGHDQMLLYMREALPVFQPDVVLLGYVTDDSLRNVTTFRDFAKPRFRIRDGNLVLEGTPVPDPETFVADQRWRSRFLDLVTMARTRVELRFGRRAEEVDLLTDALLSAIAREARAAGAKPAIALLPAWNELSVMSMEPLPAEAFVLQLAQRERVPCLRLRPLFVERARLGAEYEKVGHWGATEHRLAAEGIADFLRRESLLPPQPPSEAATSQRR